MVVGKDISVNGVPEDYNKYPYIVEVVEMLLAWKEITANYQCICERCFRQTVQIKKSR